MAGPNKEQFEQYQEDGYFIADDAVQPAMLEPLTVALRRAANMVLRCVPIVSVKGFRLQV